MVNTCSIILAAGEGTRMKSNQPKVLSKVLFKPMIGWVLGTISKLNIDSTCIVAGYKSELLLSYLNTLPYNLKTVLQTQRLGTAHAVTTADNFLRENIEKDVLILNGDAPFIDEKTILESLESHRKEENAATVISAKVADPNGYGRILRNDETLSLAAIVEQKDATYGIKKINEVNSGAYWFNVRALLSVIYDIKNDNAQKEFYLPDAISLLLSRGYKVNAFKADSEDIVLGANDYVQLNKLNCIARQRVLLKLMKNGVDIPCTDGVIITDDANIESGTCILPNTVIKGKTSIGHNCIIGPNTFIDNSLVDDNVSLNSIHCLSSHVVASKSIKPFSVIYNNKFV